VTQQEAGVPQGREVAVKGREVAVKGRGVAVKGRGVAEPQGTRGTTKESVYWQSHKKRRLPVKGRSIGRATRPL